MQNRDIKHCTAFVPYMALVLFDKKHRVVDGSYFQWVTLIL